MDESLQELENELSRLTPRAPSARFQAALEQELGNAPAPALNVRYAAATTLRSWKWVSWSLAGAVAAAAIAIALVLSPHKTPTAPTDKPPAVSEPMASVPTGIAGKGERDSNRYEPVKATAVLYDLQESAPARLPDMTEGREVRYRYVDTYTWKNRATNASLSWSVPRDEVRLVRANLD